MHRRSCVAWLGGLGLFVPSGAWAFAAPPPLPAGEPSATEPAPTDAAPTERRRPQSHAVGRRPMPAVDASGSVDASVDLGPSATATRSARPPRARATPRARSARGRAFPSDKKAQRKVDAIRDDDPGMMKDGRREPVMNGDGGWVGLFHTALPDVGGRFTFRFRVHTDFFRKEGFMYNGSRGTDTHSRVRGAVTMSFSPFKWGELYFAVKSAANRNERPQPDRQDAEAVFALGDLDFGTKGAWRSRTASASAACSAWACCRARRSCAPRPSTSGSTACSRPTSATHQEAVPGAVDHEPRVDPRQLAQGRQLRARSPTGPAARSRGSRWAATTTALRMRYAVDFPVRWARRSSSGSTRSSSGRGTSPPPRSPRSSGPTGAAPRCPGAASGSRSACAPT